MLERMDKFFDSRLDEYDAHQLGCIASAREFLRFTAEQLPSGAGCAVLDLGCGTGLELGSVYARFPAVRVKGIDLSAEMLSELRKKYAAYSPELVCGDYFAVPFGEEAFDAALSFETLHHFPGEKKGELYRKIFRALKKGGRYVECDYVACCEEEEELCRKDYERRKNVREGYLHIDIPLTKARQIGLLSAAGFRAETVYENGSTAIFVADNFFGLAAVTLFLIVTVIFSRVPFGSVLRSVKMILFLIIFTAILNLFFYSTEGVHLIWQWGILALSWESIVNMIFLAFRLFLLVMGTSILTLTTAPVELTDGIESLLKPLKYIKFPVHELALIMSIALRFIPTLMDETNRIIAAQKARGADFETGGLFKRAKAMIPVLIPLLVSAFRRAEELGDAMDARCYSGAKGRTKYKKLTFTWRDLAATLVVAALITGIVLLNVYIPGGKFGIIDYFLG